MKYIVQWNGNRTGSVHKVDLPNAKSILNRILLLGFHHGFDVDNANLDSQDLQTMKEALDAIRSGNSDASSEINIHDSGSACRFILPLLSFSPGEWTLLGTERMYNRPIGPLVDILNAHGCRIKYLEKEGHLPLQIHGVSPPDQLQADFNAPMSSQYISALLLNSSSFDKGVHIRMANSQVSLPYIYMTLSILEKLGYRVKESKLDRSIQLDVSAPENEVRISPLEIIEKDWSAASFFYLLVGSGYPDRILLKGLSNDSIQGDSKCMEFFKHLGVHSELTEEGVLISNSNDRIDLSELDLSGQPDLSIPIIVLCATKGIQLRVKGVEHLRLKESDRIEALNENLRLLGYALNGSDGSYTLEIVPVETNIEINPFSDHRIAMAFAAVSIKRPIVIKDAEVVSKSFPGFWSNLRDLGFNLQEI